MHPYLKKLKHILPAFLLITVGSVCFLAALRLLNLKYNYFEINEELWEFWIPGIFPWLPIGLWFIPRLKAFAYRDSDRKSGGFLTIVLWITAGAASVVSQNYITTATGSLSNVASVKQIATVETSRYYKIADFLVDRSLGGMFCQVTTSGRYNDKMDFNNYFAIPFVEDSVTGESTYWLAVKYHQSISNYDSESKKDIEFNKFESYCIDRINNYKFESIDHFERLPKSEKRENYLLAIKQAAGKTPPEGVVILEPTTDSYDDRNGAAFNWIFIAIAIGTVIFLVSLIFCELVEPKPSKSKQAKKSHSEKVSDAAELFIPRGEHFVTSIILDINILIFLAMIFSGLSIMNPHTEELVSWGALRRTEVESGEWWRYITAMFLHSGIFHLAFNMVTLGIASVFLEPLLGRVKFALLYLLSGIGAGIFSLWWHTNNVASVGASGAIFGLFGAIIALILLKVFDKKRIEGGFLGFVIFFVAVNLLVGLSGGINNAAHIGGLVSGAIIVAFMVKVLPIVTSE